MLQTTKEMKSSSKNVKNNYLMLSNPKKKQLENQKVQIEGHMQPVGEEHESSTFLLLENPVGCWYCEMPSLNGMVLIELKDLKVVRMSRQTQIIKGKLQLRKDDPEKFLFTILEAEMQQAP